jgi:tetratricopeptide (TPR) repeat protein
MGVVHAAWDRQLDRKVALKLVHPDRRDPRDQQRLLDEARAMAVLRHENVAVVYDVGVLDGQVFVAMEFVEGGSLRSWLRAEPRSWQAVLRTLAAAGRGLRAAHAAGLIHRDFKPDNILVGKDEVVRVADFGLARVVDQAAEPPEAVAQGGWPQSETGEVRGTPGYMAPELFLGGKADERSDQYAFAASLYEALYGQVPFRGGTIAERLSAMDRPPAAPNGKVPGWLREIVLRGLARAPGERFPSLDAMLKRLERDPAVRRQRLAWGGAGMVAAGALLALWSLAGRSPMVCGGLEARLSGVWDAGARARVARAFADSKAPFASEIAGRVTGMLDGYSRRILTSAKDACEASLRRREQTVDVMALRNACLDQRLAELRALSGILSGADAAVVANAVRAASRLNDVSGCDDVAALRRPQALPANAAAREGAARVRQLLAEGKALHGTGKLQQAVTVLEQARAAAEALGHAPVEAEAYLELANLKEVTSSNDAEPLYRAAIVRAEASGHDECKARAASRLAFHVGNEQARPGDGRLWGEIALAVAQRMGSPSLSAATQHVMAILALNEGKYREAEDRLRKALAFLEQADGRPETGPAGHMFQTLGSTFGSQGRLAEAERAFTRALGIVEREFGPEYPQAVAIRSDLTELRLQRGDFAGAAADYRALIVRGESLQGPQHPRISDWRAILAVALVWIRDLDGAREAAETAVTNLLPIRGPGHPSTTTARIALADVLVQSGHAAEAHGHLAASLPALEKYADDWQQWGAYAWNTVARVAIARGAYGEARAALDRAQRFTTTGNVDIYDQVATGALRSEVERRTGAHASARASAERALALAERSFVDSSPGLVPPLVALAEAALAAGDPARAVPALERALALLERAGAPPRWSSAERARLERARSRVGL